MTRSDIDPDVFLSEVFQRRNKISDLGEVVSNDRWTTIILDVLPEEEYSTIKVQSKRDPDLGLEKIIRMMKTNFIIILRSHQFPEGVKSCSLRFKIAVVSQECVIMCVNPL